MSKPSCDKHGNAYPGRTPKGKFPGEYLLKPERVFSATGEFRPPKKGEYYLSGAEIQAYRAPADLDTAYWIATRKEPDFTWMDADKPAPPKHSPEPILALYELVQWAKGLRGDKDGNPYCVPEVKRALQALQGVKPKLSTKR